MDKNKATESASYRLIKKPPTVTDHMLVEGHYDAQLIRDGKVVWSEKGKNLITTEGMNYMIDMTLPLAGTQVTGPWQMSIATVVTAGVDGSTGSQLGGTGAVTEFIDYGGDALREPITFAAASARASVASTASFTMDSGVSAVTINGGFICADGTATAQGGTATFLWSIFSFTAPPVVNEFDQLDVTYTVTFGSTNLAGAAV